jgi:phosphonate transport system substrate-binding protein
MAAGSGRFRADRPGGICRVQRPLDAQPVVTWVPPGLLFHVVVLDESPVRQRRPEWARRSRSARSDRPRSTWGRSTLLAKAGLTYAVDYEPVFLNRNVAVEALIKGEIAGIGLNRTHIDSITESSPTRPCRVLVKGIAVADDILLASAKVAPEVVDTVRKTFADHGEEILAALTSTEENAKYIGGTFNADRDRRRLRRGAQDVREIGITEFTEFVGE